MENSERHIDATEPYSAFELAPRLLTQWTALELFKTSFVDFLYSRKGNDIFEKVKDNEISTHEAISELSDELDKIQTKVHNK